MIGTSLDGRGGISSVVANYHSAGLFERNDIIYIAAHKNASGFVKIGCFFSALYRFWTLLLGRKVRLVHIHTASGLSFWRKSVFAWSAVLWQCPVVLHIHSGAFDSFIKSRGRLARLLAHALIARCRRVVVLSDSWIQKFESIFPTANFVTLANPVILREVHRSEFESDGLVRVLFLGRLSQIKGVFDLVQAFGLIHKRAPSLRLILAGEGDRDLVVNLSNELGVSEKIQLLGWISGSTKEWWLDHCAIFALPSYIEGLPVSMLEAMVAEEAVVMTDVGSVSEVLSHGVDGWVVPIGDVSALATALLTLATDTQMRSRLAAAGRVTVSAQYAAPRILARLKGIYREALG